MVDDAAKDYWSVAGIVGALIAFGVVGNVLAMKRATGAIPVERGLASIYGNNDGYEWKPTASGTIMDPGSLTAAHRTLPFATRVRVVNLNNKLTVIVTIDNRGPFKAGRIIDLTPAGAHAIGFDDGLVPVEVEVQ